MCPLLLAHSFPLLGMVAIFFFFQTQTAKYDAIEKKNVGDVSYACEICTITETTMNKNKSFLKAKVNTT